MTSRHPKIDPRKSQDAFRRSRTIVKTPASDGQNTNLKSDRSQKQSSKKKRKKTAGIGVAIIVIAYSLYYLASGHISSVQVIATPQSSSKKPPIDEYQDSIGTYLAARPTEQFDFSLKPDNLTSYMQQGFAEIKKIKLETDKTGESQFQVELRQPVASWNVNGQQFFVDASGAVFQKNYLLKPSVSVVDKSGAPELEKGDKLVSKNFLRFLGRLVALINTSGLGVVTEASLPPGVTRQIDIRLEGRGYLVKTHIDRDPANEVEDLRRTISYLQSRQINPSYIDLRVKGKAFYR